jgi:hypothetical protein
MVKRVLDLLEYLNKAFDERKLSIGDLHSVGFSDTVIQEAKESAFVKVKKGHYQITTEGYKYLKEMKKFNQRNNPQKKIFTLKDRKDIRNGIIVTIVGGLILGLILLIFNPWANNLIQPSENIPSKIITNSYEDFDLYYRFMDINTNKDLSNMSILFTINAKAHMEKVGFSYNKSNNITNILFNKDGYEREDNDNLDINMKAYPKLTVEIPRDIPKEQKWIRLAIYFQNNDGITVVDESKKIFLNLITLNVSNESFFFITTNEGDVPDIFYNGKNNVNTQITIQNGTYFFDSNGDGTLDYAYDPLTKITKPFKAQVEFPMILILVIILILLIIIILAFLLRAV